MDLITVREWGWLDQSLMVKLAFPEGSEYELTLQDPITAPEERLWEWYFEEHLEFPLVDQVQAGQAAESVRAYGGRLFEQVFGDRGI